MKNNNNSQEVAEALILHLITELGRVILRDDSNEELTRLLRHIDRTALGVPVFKKGENNENSNIIELTNMVTNCRDANRVRHHKRVARLIRRGTRFEH